MKYLFFIQGEGRGHMTQALALKEKLENRGHAVVAVVVGSASRDELPTFFKEQIKSPLFTVDSPRFIVDASKKGIKIFASARQAFWRFPNYLASIKKIKKIVTEFPPDIFVNFYEPLAGNYYRFSRDRRPMFCIGHQHFIAHPAFRFPPLHWLTKFSFRLYNRLTAPRRTIKIALSFTAENDCPEKNLFVCPPLIRQAIKQTVPVTGNFLLVYLLNSGYSEEIISWAKANPTSSVRAFWNNPGEEKAIFGPNLVFYQLSGQQFIDNLSSCRAYVATAGFDSIAEAAYLQKPILMIPTINHFEQKSNAFDAERAGLAITATNFNLSLITDHQKTHSPEARRAFKEWVDKNDNKILSLLEK
jgi:uncharacterized protein (TIGR00661 family)